MQQPPAASAEGELEGLPAALRCKVRRTLDEARALATRDAAGVVALRAGTAPVPLLAVPRYSSEVHDLRALWRAGSHLIGGRDRARHRGDPVVFLPSPPCAPRSSGLWPRSPCSSSPAAPRPGRRGYVRWRCPTQEVQGDLALARMNDEELFAAGSSAFAAGDARRAAACFERLVTSFPESPHLPPGALQRRPGAGATSRLGRRASPLHRGRRRRRAPATRSTPPSTTPRRCTTWSAIPEAITLLGKIAGRTDLPAGRRLEAQVQKGICQVDSGDLDAGEKTLRSVLAGAQAATEPRRAGGRLHPGPGPVLSRERSTGSTARR